MSVGAPPIAAWALAREAVAEDLERAPAGRIVRVRLPLDGFAVVMIADGRGGATQRRLERPSDVAWLAAEDPQAAGALEKLLERRAADVASGVWQKRMKQVEDLRKILEEEARREYWRDYWGPYVEVGNRVIDLTRWVADLSAADLAEGWRVGVDATWAAVQAIAAKAKKVVGVFKIVGWVGLFGAGVWLWDKAQPRKGAR